MKRIVILIAALLAFLPALANAAFPGRNGAIVYGYDDGSYGWDDQLGSDANFVEKSIRVRTGRDESRFLAGCTEVYLSDSACERQSFSDPAFSPDGARMVLDAGTSLALVDFDGSNFRLLPAHGQDEGMPAFSPNGSQLAFGSGAPFRYGHPSHRSVWISDADGADARRLVEGDAPAWSSRGWIAFVRQRAVYRVRPDGSGLKLLARNAAAPEWSPDGRRLAVSSLATRDRQTRRIVSRAGVLLMDANGSQRHLLPNGELDGPVDIAWSPDGRRLLALAEDLTKVDLNGRLIHDYGESYYDGAEDVWETNSIAWQPLPR
jgi:Tol biopolymer transport system component